MKLQEILKEYVPSAEIKQRIKNKQIKINNVVVDNTNIELDVTGHYWSLGNFILYNLTGVIGDALSIFPIKDEFNESSIPLLNFCEGYILLTISKKEDFVFIKN